MDTVLRFDQVSHAYGAVGVFHDLSFSLARGQIVCLLGASGCGKTTVLRCIAGFEPLVAGRILINGVEVARPGRQVPPEKRQVGMVFQDYALFPHLTVAGNIGFGLRSGNAAQRSARVAELLEVIGLAQSGGRYPHELSGGQQQRVALARALAPRPELLLLDEPFSNLDVEMRERLGQEVRDILKQQGTTAILVTHDQSEAFAVADEIGILDRGRLAQWDTPYNLYHRPANHVVADFIGKGVFLPGIVLDDHRIDIGIGKLTGDLPGECGKGCAGCENDCDVEVLLRPDDIVHDDASPLKARVVHKTFRGADILYTLALPDGREALSVVPSHHNHAIGELIGIRVEADHVIVFRREARAGAPPLPRTSASSGPLPTQESHAGASSNATAQ
ncbi:MAG: ABC transporter ATP-binding protein [Burkholderiales bacterium]|nr:ABC transporter ATP-binding protein [Burkholderiales bacterium]